MSNKPTKVTAHAYRDKLQRLWILDPLDAWLPGYNHLGRLNVAPKHYLADPALAARLLELSASSLLGLRAAPREQPRDGAQLGQLFESLVVMCVRVFAQAAQARVAHLRTQAGRHEIDLIVSGEAGRVLAIEVKLTASPTDSDVGQLRWLASEIGDDLIDAVVVTTGPYAYRRRDGIAVVPAALLGA